MKILITGGAGFIGANTASHFLQKGDEITLFDNLSRPGVEGNINWLRQQYPKSKIEFVKGDVKDFDLVKKHVKGKDVIFHLAGQTAVTTSVSNPRADFESNALGSFNVVEALRLVAPEAILIYSSTNKVYGAMSRVNTRRRGLRYYSVESPSVDESEQLDFYSPYGCSKGAGDQYIHDYSRIYGLKTIVFRQSCIYGAHQFGVEDQGWVAHFTSLVIQGKTIKIFGDGKQVRDMLYITDLVNAYDSAIEKINITSGQVYNIGGGIANTMSLLELIKYLEELTGKPIKTKYFEERLGDQKTYVTNIDKAFRDLGWSPEVGVREGMKKLYDWLNKSLNE